MYTIHSSSLHGCLFFYSCRLSLILPLVCVFVSGSHTFPPYVPPSDRALLRYLLPVREVVMNFFGELKSVSSGFASFDYEDAGWVDLKVPKKWSTDFTSNIYNTLYYGKMLWLAVAGVRQKGRSGGRKDVRSSMNEEDILILSQYPRMESYDLSIS